MNAPLRLVVGMSETPVYFVHGDRKRPVHDTLLACGHRGYLVEAARRNPKRQRCHSCGVAGTMDAVRR